MLNYNKIAAITLALLLTCLLVNPLNASSLAKSHKKPKFTLSAVAIFNDEAPYLQEWIEYHRLIGVEHFYLYNNRSSDNYAIILKPYISSGIVDLIDWPHKPNNWEEWNQIQVNAYQDCLNNVKDKTHWLAIIDIDEFIVPVKTDNLKTLLGEHSSKNVGGICLIWSFFGTSHVEKIPSNQTLIETLLYHSGIAAGGNVAAIWNSGAYKSIVRPKYVTSIPSPHYCLYTQKSEHMLLDYNQIRINHYWSRDIDYLYNHKIPRRNSWNQDSSSVLQWAEGMNQRTDDNPIIRFVQPLRERLNLY